MNVRGKVTPRMRARVFELKREGLSNRAIAKALEAEGLGLSRQGVADVLDAGGTAEMVAPSPKAPPKGKRSAAVQVDEPEEEDHPPSSRPPPPLDADEDDDIEAERVALDALLARRPEALPKLPPDATLPARAVWWDLAAVRAEVAALRPKVRDGSYSATQWLSLVKEATKLAKDLAGLLPPPPPDAAKDPANIQARAMVHAHVLQSIEAAEARCGRLCTRCREDVAAGRAA
jgi:hypothetical protein